MRAFAARLAAIVVLAAAVAPSGCAISTCPEVESPGGAATVGPSSSTITSTAAPILPEGAARVSFDRLVKFPDPGWHVPRAIHFAPGGTMATFLASESQSDRMALFAVDVATGAVRVLVRSEDLPARKGEMSQEEQLRRERQRSRLEGITEYVWAEDADVMVIPAGGDVVVRLKDGALRRLTETEAPELDPRPCPTGERVAWVRDGDLFVFDLAGNAEKKLTRGGAAGTTRGLSDFVAQEEFDEPSGYFWSPDCKSIAYLEVDERGVETVPVLGYRKAGEAVRMDQRYPRAGRPNPRVALRLIDVASGRDRPVAMPADAGSEPYLMRFEWSHDAGALWLQALPRDQKKRVLVRVDAASAAARPVASVEARAWVEPSPFLIAPDDQSAFWLEPDAERGLDDRITRVDLRSGQRRAVTQPGASAFALHGLDAAGRVLFATTNRDGVLGRRLEAVPVDGGAARFLTPEPGTHAVVVGAKGAAIIDVHSANDRMPVAVLRGADGAVRAQLPVGRDADLETLALRPPRMIRVEHAGTTLHGAVLAPRDHDPSRRYPLVLMVYGGPGVQMVTDRWSPRPQWQHLADRGFFVAQFDNRGTSGRGPAFAHAVAGRLGVIELEDQEAALRALLAAEPSIDPARVGIYGHSYGGFLSALAMLKRPGLFRAAASGSPVTDWRLYDSGYTERYMGLPGANEAGYAASRLPDLAGELRGSLMLLHGMMDENVHVEHTAKLADALVAAGKPFDLVLFPAERHGYRSPTARAYANRRVVDFFARELSP